MHAACHSTINITLNMSDQAAGTTTTPIAQQEDAKAGAASNNAGDDKGSAEDPSSSSKGCPICEFIEAGPCGDQHKVWVACRGKAKEEEVDYVTTCADTFRSFFGCMLSHQDYYRPFLEAFHVDTDLSQEAIDRANARKGGEGQQDDSNKQQQAQQAGAAAAPPLQTQQQQHGATGSGAPPAAAAAAAAAQKPGGSSTSGSVAGALSQHAGTEAAGVS